MSVADDSHAFIVQQKGQFVFFVVVVVTMQKPFPKYAKVGAPVGDASFVANVEGEARTPGGAQRPID